MTLLWVLAVIAAFTASIYTYVSAFSSEVNISSLPPQAVVSIFMLKRYVRMRSHFDLLQFVDKLSFAVVGNDGDFRQSAFTQFFNPTNTTPPFFQVFDSSFLSILGKSPSIRVISSNPQFAFAHEAPIWLPDTDQVTFVSNDGGPLGMSDIDHNNQVNVISLKDVEAAIQVSESKTSPLNVSFTKVRVELQAGNL